MASDLTQDFLIQDQTKKSFYRKDQLHVIMKPKQIGKEKETLVPLKRDGLIYYGQVLLLKSILDFSKFFNFMIKVNKNVVKKIKVKNADLNTIKLK